MKASAILLTYAMQAMTAIVGAALLYFAHDAYLAGRPVIVVTDIALALLNGSMFCRQVKTRELWRKMR